MATLILTGSVGTGKSEKGIPHNEVADVIKVSGRFVELGYHWVSGVSDGNNKDLVRLIKFFQTIVKGHPKFDSGDGRIDVQGSTHKWLAAANAPGWVNMEGKTGIGWQIAKFDYGNSWTTTWMLDGLILAGVLYRGMAALAPDVTDAPSMWVRDCSPEKGGKATGHGSHQTGLDMDMRLPLLPPNTGEFTQLRGQEYNEKFHRKAAFLQVRAIKAMMNTKYIFFNDPEFTGPKLTSYEDNHSEHYHIRIKTQPRIEGIV